MASQTVPGLLAMRAAESPDRTAIALAGGGRLSFGEWESRSSALAGRLRLSKGDRVGLRFDEHDWIDYAVAYVAVQKARGVAVPISARMPAEQVRELLDTVSASLLALEEESRPLSVDIGPGDLAQILFTSGTTGQPKGVSATHANLTHGYHPAMKRRPLSHSQLFLHAFPIGTNAAQTMLINALVAEPAALAMPRFDAEGFCELIASYRVGTVFVVPAMAVDLLNSGAHHRHDLSSVLLFGSTAAALPPAVALELSKAFPNAEILNYYSSTEAMPAQTIMVFDPQRPGAVGQPEPDELMIAGEEGQPVPTGEIGEVWLRAPASPRAYYGDPHASAEVFRKGWTRMGDLGYLDDDGYLFLVDRESDVVKSGAYKVSTLRIEAALYEHPEVAQAAALGIPHPVMGTMPAAAVVLRRPIALDGIRAFLKERLAQHEVPTRLLAVESLPRNDAGKVVKRELRALFEVTIGPVQTGTAVEKALGELWLAVLNTRSLEGDFFALGGDSFAAARLAAMASERFSVRVPAALAFDHPTLPAQAKWIESQQDVAAPSAVDMTGVPLSSLQEYFLRWIHETPEPRAVSAVAVAIRITDELDIPALHRALDQVAARHDALRMVFTPSPAVLPECPPDFTLTEASNEDEALRLACEELERPFDLSRGPLFRALVIRLGDEDHVLVLGVHHLAFDGWSMGNLLRDLSVFYASRQPEPLALTSIEVSAWARAQWPETRMFWERALHGAPAALTGAPNRLPAHHFTGASLPLGLSAELAGRVRATAAAHNVTTYMTLLTAWADVLSRWSGSSEVVVMSPVPGRTRPEFDPVIGCLVQSLLLRINTSHKDLLAHVRSVVLDAVEHQFYPYEEFSRRVPYPAWFRFESWEGPAHLPGLLSEQFELPRELMFDWPLREGEVDLSVPELALTEQPDGTITGWLVFNRHCFDQATVHELGQIFLRYLENG